MTTSLATYEQNKQIIRGFFKALNEIRLEDLPIYMASDVIDHNKVIFGEADEPGAAFEGFRQQLAAFGPARLQVEELLADGDRVVARLTMNVVHSGYHPRMPEPTHRSAAVECIYIFTIRNNKISEIRAVSDRLGLFLQLGWDWPTVD